MTTYDLLIILSFLVLPTPPIVYYLLKNQRTFKWDNDVLCCYSCKQYFRRYEILSSKRGEGGKRVCPRCRQLTKLKMVESTLWDVKVPPRMSYHDLLIMKKTKQILEERKKEVALFQNWLRKEGHIFSGRRNQSLSEGIGDFRNNGSGCTPKEKGHTASYKNE